MRKNLLKYWEKYFNISGRQMQTAMICLEPSITCWHSNKTQRKGIQPQAFTTCKHGWGRTAIPFSLLHVDCNAQLNTAWLDKFRCQPNQLRRRKNDYFITTIWSSEQKGGGENLVNLWQAITAKELTLASYHSKGTHSGKLSQQRNSLWQAVTVKQPSLASSYSEATHSTRPKKKLFKR